MKQYFNIDDFEFELNTSVDVIKEGEYYPQTLEEPAEYPEYSLQVNIDEIDWDEDEYTEEENKVIKDFIDDNEELIIKRFEQAFKRTHRDWDTESFYEKHMQDYEEKYEYYVKGGKVKKMYAILVSPMGEMIADVEVDSRDERTARQKFMELGITQSGSIRFTNNQPHYYKNGGELEEEEDVLMDKIYDAEFGMYRVGDYFIIPEDDERFPYHVLNREGAILYKAESILDAIDWADERYQMSDGGAGTEIVILAKNPENQKVSKFRFLVYEDNEEDAKKIACKLWEDSFTDLELDVLEILTDEELRNKSGKKRKRFELGSGGNVKYDKYNAIAFKKGGRVKRVRCKLATGGFLSFPATGKFVKLSDYYKTLPDKNLLVGLKVYDEVNEEYIYIKSVEDGIFAGKNKNDDYGHYYSMPYLLVDKKYLS